MFLTVSDQSSTALHILLHVNIAYSTLWFIIEIPLFIFKYYQLPFPTFGFGLEIASVFMLSFNEYIRQFLGIKGNLTLQNSLLIIFIIYGIFCAIGYVFFLLWQSYVQRTEILLSGIGLALIAIEILLSIITLIRNSRPMPVLTTEEKLARVNRGRQRLQAIMQNQ